MKSTARNTSRRRQSTVFGASAIAFVVAAGLSPALPAAADGGTATVYAVVQEGLTVDDGARLADAFGVGNALHPNGAFGFVDDQRFQYVPQQTVERGEDEDGNPTISEAVDLAALRQIEPYPEGDALSRSKDLAAVALLSEGMNATPRVSHSEFSLTDDKGNVVHEQPIDTQVSFDITLDGLPLTGQGARLRISFDEKGYVTELTQSLRLLKPSHQVDVIGVDEARDRCSRLYGGSEQDDPTLGYQMPELTSANADGKGTITEVHPQYTCHPVGQDTTEASRLVPAVRDAAPEFKISVDRNGESITGVASVGGGTAPYTYNWSSSTTVLSGNDAEKVTYRRTSRDGSKSERLTLEVTDANGLVAIAYVDVDSDGNFSAVSEPGGGGFALASVGIEQTVDEWQCAQDSANGFKSVMQSKGQTVKFDWRGWAAFEKDFKDPAFGGWDNSYVDAVDAQWYTGHGSPYGFTFKSNVDDQWLTPNEARWGNTYNLEWLQLESCQVLRGVNSPHDYVNRWGQAFRGLHMMNGFHTNAYCVGGGTGGTFANYLFPVKWWWWTLRPAYKVRSAWAAMALAKEPHGVVYRSFGPARRLPNGTFLTNAGDYFWGQGPTGPDILPSGYWWTVSGTV